MSMVAAVGCSSPGRLVPPTGWSVAGQPCARGDRGDVLLACAPVILQEASLGARRLDQPTRLDPDDSGTLVDDWAVTDDVAEGRATEDGVALRRLESQSDHAVPLYTHVVEDPDHWYLFYGLYYPLDWSGSPSRPRIDHVGDLEGALVVVDRRSGNVEAVVTQAHKRYHVFLGAEIPTRPSRAAGSLALTPDGRPILFAESGGHGLYAYGSGPWRPKGGRAYPEGPAAVPEDHLAVLAPEPLPFWPAATHLTTTLRPLSDLAAFTTSPTGPFRDLPRGATPPWLWRSPAGPAGQIVRNPAALYAHLLDLPPSRDD